MMWVEQIGSRTPTASADQYPVDSANVESATEGVDLDAAFAAIEAGRIADGGAR